MASTESRSDTRSVFVDADRGQVFAAIEDPARIARWWGPDGFSNTIEIFEFVEGGRWRSIMHGPDGADYPNESLFLEIVRERRVVVEHLSGHRFILTLDLVQEGGGTRVDWRQTFDTREHYEQIAAFVAKANRQNLERLVAEVRRSIDTR